MVNLTLNMLPGTFTCCCLLKAHKLAVSAVPLSAVLVVWSQVISLYTFLVYLCIIKVVWHLLFLLCQQTKTNLHLLHTSQVSIVYSVLVQSLRDKTTAAGT